MKVFCDLDGVLADFVAAVEEQYGITVDSWDFMSKIPGRTPAQFWDTCSESFWAGLNWTPDGKDILKILEDRFKPQNICLLSSPCATPGCMEGKKRWIDKNLPDYKRRFLMGPAKDFCAGPNKLLVDDYDENIRRFVLNGGLGITIPRKWNSLGEKAMLKQGAEFDMAGYLNNTLKMNGFCT